MIRYLLLLIIILTCISFTANANHDLYDSLRMETRNGKSFIVHKVEAKETLFSISRRYHVKVDEILESNDGLENGLKMYQELFVPYASIVKKESVKQNIGNKIHIAKQGETLYAISRLYNISVEDIKVWNKLAGNDIGLGDTLIVGNDVGSISTVAATNKIENQSIIKHDSLQTDRVDSDTSKYHIVSASETLYSISLKYKIDMNDVKKWNNLESNNLSIGQKLLLDLSLIDSINSETIAENVKPIDTIYVTTDNSRFKTKVALIDSLENTQEEGFATQIENTEDTRKYLALHREALIGTVIEVNNQMNNRSIFVRVVGKLPETGLNRNVLIRLSYAAFAKLGALDPKIPVEITYINE